MTDNEVHPLVTLLTERMKSHPEEFENYRYDMPETTGAIRLSDRWDHVLDEVKVFGTEADNDALTVELRDIRLNKAHQWMIDELLNGDERRAQAQREAEAEAQRYKAQMAQAMQGQLIGAGGAGGVSTGSGGGGGSSWYPNEYIQSNQSNQTSAVSSGSLRGTLRNYLGLK